MRSKNKPAPTVAEKRHIEQDTEIWAPVLGFEGLYAVSSLGRIRSLSRAWKSKYTVTTFPGRVLTQVAKSNRYLVVSLSKDNKARQCLVHRIVLEAFVSPCPEGMEACHANGDRQDNRASNLRWDTRSANHQDKKLHGTAQVGEKANNAKLTDQIVQAIRRRGLRPSEAMREFGLSKTNAARIVNNVTWKHIHA